MPLKAERLARYFKTFKKEWFDIISAAGYEHSCQFDINTTEMNVDDHNLVKDFCETFRNKKTPVTFKSLQHLKDCEYLGGQIKKN